ncbi:hypothetical protein PN499_05270 [Kamptonema animale CS-326]|jgi:hypothetical protein|uniref:hypothetical protein n=1 Tax=Kamptonema animale TaxID=92934 RepID=UPI00233149D6|nr:hypothetical protein [Kamptonema animale]MDB9510586.1 hypothetical protein [Kamptonema animale CS-326]
MKLETEQLLGTLEVFCKNINRDLFCEIEENTDEYPTRAFFWESEEKGEFNVLNLTIANGLARLTDVELAIESWQLTERRGTAGADDYYTPDREKRDNILDTDTEAERTEKYQSLWQLLNSNLREIQAFNLSAHHQLPNSLEWSHPYFNFCVVIGQTDDDEWMCLSPTIPNQVGFPNASSDFISGDAQILCDRSLGENTLALASQIQTVLAELTPIGIYGYYNGGYNYTYEYKIVGAASVTKARAFEQALQAAEMLRVTTLNSVDTINLTSKNEKLFEFLNSKLRDIKAYHLSFWDIGYIYKIGQATTGDWLGISAIAEFEYNP